MNKAMRWILAIALLSASGVALSGQPIKVDQAVEAQLRAGKQVDVLVLLDDSAEQAELRLEEASLPELSRRNEAEYNASMQRRTQKFAALKRNFKTIVSGDDLENLQDYSVLPVLEIRLKSPQALERLKTHPRVKSIDENRQAYPQLIHSLPLIGQPLVSANGFSGAGTSVCVLDTGIQATAFSPTNTAGDPATSSAQDIRPIPLSSWRRRRVHS